MDSGVLVNPSNGRAAIIGYKSEETVLVLSGNRTVAHNIFLRRSPVSLLYQSSSKGIVTINLFATYIYVISQLTYVFVILLCRSHLFTSCAGKRLAAIIL